MKTFLSPDMMAAVQERLRMRRREREDAEVRRAARKVKTPTASDKFKTRSYDRPWAVGKPENRKVTAHRENDNTLCYVLFYE